MAFPLSPAFVFWVSLIGNDIKSASTPEATRAASLLSSLFHFVDDTTESVAGFRMFDVAESRRLHVPSLAPRRANRRSAEADSLRVVVVGMSNASGSRARS